MATKKTGGKKKPPQYRDETGGGKKAPKPTKPKAKK